MGNGPALVNRRPIIGRSDVTPDELSRGPAIRPTRTAHRGVRRRRRAPGGPLTDVAVCSAAKGRRSTRPPRSSGAPGSPRCGPTRAVRVLDPRTRLRSRPSAGQPRSRGPRPERPGGRFPSIRSSSPPARVRSRRGPPTHRRYSARSSPRCFERRATSSRSERSADHLGPEGPHQAGCAHLGDAEELLDVAPGEQSTVKRLRTGCWRHRALPRPVRRREDPRQDARSGAADLAAVLTPSIRPAAAGAEAWSPTRSPSQGVAPRQPRTCLTSSSQDH